MQFRATRTNTYIRLDPRTKFIVLFFVGFYMFSIPGNVIEASIMAVVGGLLVASGQWRSAVKMTAVYACMLLLDIFVSPFLSGAFSTLFYTVVRLARMLLPIMGAALLLIRTTTVSEFITAFRKMHLPDAFIIPVSVMFRFIPTVSEEWSAIRNAMRFRGIGLSAKSVLTKPMSTLEYMLVPMLMSTATISGDLAAASLSRGLESGSERTCVQQVRFGALDVAVLLACLGLLIVWGVDKFG